MQLSPKAAMAFVDDATDGMFDAADSHHIHPALAQVLVFEDLLTDLFAASAQLTRDYVAAALAELATPDGSDEERQRSAIRSALADQMVEILQAEWEKVELTTTVIEARRVN